MTTHALTARAEGASGLDRWSLFAGLWGWALLMHQATFDRWQHSAIGCVLVLLAMGLVLAPRSLPLFFATVTVDAIYAFQCLPETANHLVFEGLVCAVWSVGILLGALSAWRRREPPAQFWSRAAGAGASGGKAAPHPLEGSRAPLKVGLLLVYWISVLHKLNYDFVDPATSCASYMYRRVSESLPFLPQAVWAEHLAIWGTLLAEAALPVLLMSRRFWQLGLVAALSFHLMLGFDPTPGIYSFTGLLFALFVLVLPGRFIDTAVERLDALRGRVGARPLLYVRVAGMLVMASILAYGSTRSDHWSFYAVFVFFLAWSALVIGGYLITLFAVPADAPPVDSTRAVALPALHWAWVLPCVVLLNGLNPYLGLRTQLSFSMFSNLRTEGGISNHLFMPRRIFSLAGYQEDLVEILESDDADFAEYQKQQLLLPYFEFRRMMSGIEDVRVTYLRAGQQHTFECKDGHCNDAELAQPYSGLVRRLLYFRPVDKGPRMLCRH
jgi:hypothetical protein